MAITKDFIRNEEQELVNGLLYPKSIDDYWNSWIDEGTNYIKSIINIEAAEQGQIDLWLKYFIEYRMYGANDFNDTVKDRKRSLDNMLATVRENQILGINAKNTGTRINATSGTSVFPDSVFKDAY